MIPTRNPSTTKFRPKEDTIHQQVADYLKIQYPNVLFRTDFAAGIKMTLGQATRHKRLQQGRAYPDIFIAEPRNGYSGLFLELKRDGTPIYLRNGELSANPHIREQAETLKILQEKGYAAAFAIGFDNAKHWIDQYLG